MCKRYPTSARCCRSRSTRNAWAMTQLDTVPCTTITTFTTWPATTTQRSRRSKWNPTYRSRVKAPTLFLCPGSGGESTVLYCQFLNYRWRLAMHSGDASIVVVTIDLILTFNLKYSAIKQSWSVLRINFTNVTFVLVMLVKMEVHFLYLDVRVSVWVVPPLVLNVVSWNVARSLNDFQRVTNTGLKVQYRFLRLKFVTFFRFTVLVWDVL